MERAKKNGINIERTTRQNLRQSTRHCDKYSDMRKILDSKTYTNDQEKLKDYLRVLQRYLFFAEEKRTVGKDNNYEDSSGMSEGVIVESVPKHYQKKAQLLLSHLKNNRDRIKWGESGEVYIDG